MPWSGHPRGYKVAKWSLGSVQSVCCFEVAGLGVRLGVVVSGAVVTGSQSCVDVLRLSALEATDGEM